MPLEPPLKLEASERLLRALPRHARSALVLYMDDINKANYPFPGKTYKLSMSDAYYLINNINEISQIFQQMTFYWNMPDQKIKNARPEMHRRLFTEQILPFANRFIYYYESVRELCDLFADEYGISFQIVYYNTDGYV